MNAELKWEEFIKKLSQAKKEKKNKGLSVSSITNLIYSGAFDSMVEGIKPIKESPLLSYHQMYEEVKDALKSKASLPKATKTQIIGLSEVNTIAGLNFWRYESNPLHQFDMLKLAETSFKERGFEETNLKQFRYSRNPADKDQRMEWVTDKWSEIFNMPKTGPRGAFWMALTKGVQGLVIVGVIAKSEIKTYSNGQKERLVVSVYNGRETVRDLVVWPDRKGDGKISEYAKSTLRAPNFCMLWVRPSLWNEKKNGTIEKWEQML